MLKRIDDLSGLRPRRRVLTRPKPSTAVLAGIAAAVLGLVVFWYAIPARVVAYEVGANPIAWTLTGPGLLDADNKVTITAKIQARISEIPVTRNDAVTKGQVVARFEADDLVVQEGVAEADSEAAQRAVDEARSQRARSQAGLDRLSQDLDRKRRLAATGSVSKVDLDASDAAFKQGQAEMVELQQENHATVGPQESRCSNERLAVDRPGAIGLALQKLGEIIGGQILGFSNGEPEIRQRQPDNLDIGAADQENGRQFRMGRDDGPECVVELVVVQFG